MGEDASAEETLPDDEAVPEHDSAAHDHEERVEEMQERSDLLKEAWGQTLEDMEALAEEHRENGREVTAIPAVDTGPIGRDTNNPDGEFGLEFVVADNHADEFVAAFEDGDYPEYDVYRAEVEAEVFVVVELTDPDADRAILLAGAYPLRDEAMCAYAAREDGEMYTFVRTLDGTRHGAFYHDGYLKFFPRADEMPEDPAELTRF